MSSFTKAFPTFEKLDDGRNGYRLSESFIYYTTLTRKGEFFPMNVTIWVHDQFYTDLMSGPDWLKKHIGLEREDYATASILHDHMYRYRIAKDAAARPIKLTRKECDKIMQEAMLVILAMGDDAESGPREIIKIRKVYSFLRWFGWAAWLKWRFVGFFS